MTISNNCALAATQTTMTLLVNSLIEGDHRLTAESIDRIQPEDVIEDIRGSLIQYIIIQYYSTHEYWMSDKYCLQMIVSPYKRTLSKRLLFLQTYKNKII